MNDLILIKDNIPTVSHIVIAQNTNNKVNSIRDLISRNKADFEEFGELKQTSLQGLKGGKPKITYYLNEEQYSLLMTYIKNNQIVKKFKINMVKAFFKMKELLPQTPNHQLQRENIELKRTLNRVLLNDINIEQLKEQNLKYYKELSETKMKLQKIKNIL